MWPHRDELAEVLGLVGREAEAYLRNLDRLPARGPAADDLTEGWNTPLPGRGSGAANALRTLIERGRGASVASSGPRCFHFVIGGVTPAAFGADWLTTVYDQIAYAWVSSPLAVKLEVVALSWLKELFALPSSWGGVMTTGATMANFVGLAAARQWWSERHGVDVAEEGLTSLPTVPVFSGGHVHASAIKCLGMLGVGRSALERFSMDDTGRLDLNALRDALERLEGKPAILIGNAGEVNAGDFDPIDAMADLAEHYGAWLHVDGAFGLFARISPRTEHLTQGLERAHSVTVDGHKWLNVPYDSGFAFVRNPSFMAKAFAYAAAYLPDPDDPQPNMGTIGPESSRRGRSLAVWATLQAYGREGYRGMVEHHLDLAQKLASLVDDDPLLERLADVPLNIVCFRYNPGGLSEATLDLLNERLGEAIIEDGRVYVGTTRFGSRVALRPAIVNWRTGEGDIELLVDVVREIGGRLSSSM